MEKQPKKNEKQPKKDEKLCCGSCLFYEPTLGKNNNQAQVGVYNELSPRKDGQSAKSIGLRVCVLSYGKLDNAAATDVSKCINPRTYKPNPTLK